ncbi:MAG: GNAT family N-acetyltransferase [Pseudonocardiaceae bacterium]
MAAVADDETLSLIDLATSQEDGRAWVITDDADRPVAYLLIDVVDGNAHVEQVSVHPDHARQSLGAALLDTAAAWAEQPRKETTHNNQERTRSRPRHGDISGLSRCE